MFKTADACKKEPYSGFSTICPWRSSAGSSCVLRAFAYLSLYDGTVQPLFARLTVTLLQLVSVLHEQNCMEQSREAGVFS
jgi:hypothetical protein